MSQRLRSSDDLVADGFVKLSEFFCSDEWQEIETSALRVSPGYYKEALQALEFALVLPSLSGAAVGEERGFELKGKSFLVVDEEPEWGRIFFFQVAREGLVDVFSLIEDDEMGSLFVFRPCFFSETLGSLNFSEMTFLRSADVFDDFVTESVVTVDSGNVASFFEPLEELWARAETVFWQQKLYLEGMLEGLRYRTPIVGPRTRAN